MAEQRQIAKIVLVVVLAVVLTSVLVFRTGIVKFGARKTDAGKQAKAGQTAKGDAKKEAPNTDVKWTRPDDVGLVKNDPMRMDMSKKQVSTGTKAAPTEPEFRVAGIVYNKDQSSSIIVDGSILHVGDTIHGATVTKITETYAELKRANKTWQIKAGQTNREPK